jgi:hypothetical protein
MLSFLAGEWKAESQSTAGPQPSVLGGDFTAQFDLHAWVLTLKGSRRPDASEDIMFVYSGCGSEHANGAVYVDGAGHTVQHCTFEILFPPNRSRPNGVTFNCPSLVGYGPLSFTYRELRPGTIRIDLAGPPKTYSAIAHRIGRLAGR